MIKGIIATALLIVSSFYFGACQDAKGAGERETIPVAAVAELLLR